MTDKFSRLNDFLELRSKDIKPETDENRIFTDSGIESMSEYFKEGQLALDVGCGQGYALDKFRDSGINVIGITLGEADCEKSKARGHDVRQMDMHFMEFEDEYFDIVWARHCLEHSIMPFFLLSEFKRVMKKDGIMYIEVPAPETPSKNELDPNHYSVFDKTMIISLLNRLGLNIKSAIILDGHTYRGTDMYYRFIVENEDNT